MMVYWMGFLGLLVGLAWYYSTQAEADSTAPMSNVPHKDTSIHSTGMVFDESQESPMFLFDDSDSCLDINPATGLLMMDGMIDVGGNPFGTDGSHPGIGTMNDGDSPLSHWEDSHGINPANGLPMMDSAIDVAGNPYGSDEFSSSFNSFDDDFSTSSSSSFSDDSFMSSSSGWDDSSWM